MSPFNNKNKYLENWNSNIWRVRCREQVNSQFFGQFCFYLLKRVTLFCLLKTFCLFKGKLEENLDGRHRNPLCQVCIVRMVAMCSFELFGCLDIQFWIGILGAKELSNLKNCWSNIDPIDSSTMKPKFFSNRIHGFVIFFIKKFSNVLIADNENYC